MNARLLLGGEFTTRSSDKTAGDLYTRAMARPASKFLLFCLFTLDVTKCASNQLEWADYSLAQLADAVNDLPVLIKDEGKICRQKYDSRKPCQQVLYSGKCQPGEESDQACSSAFWVDIFTGCVRYSCLSPTSPPEIKPEPVKNRVSTQTSDPITAASKAPRGRGNNVASTKSGSLISLTKSSETAARRPAAGISRRISVAKSGQSDILGGNVPNFYEDHFPWMHTPYFVHRGNHRNFVLALTRICNIPGRGVSCQVAFW